MKILLIGSNTWNHGRPAYITTENAGAGSFLDPPFAKSHKYGIVAGYDSGNGYQEYSGIESYLTDEHVPASAKAQIRRIIGKTETPPIETPEVQKWVSEVLGYFRNCYQGENGSWNASDLVISKSGPIDKHAGVHLIRKFYPEFTPTQEQLNNAKWGN